MKPKISIITVTYNSAKTLERTIKSVIEQGIDDLEYIIVDGGSTDGTLDIIKKYEYFISRWISEKDNGVYDAMNKGIRLATGEWVHLVNSDDYYENSDVLKTVAPILQNPEECFYSFSMYQESKGKRNKYSWDGSVNKLWYSAYLPHPTMFVSKYIYDKFGLYDTAFHIAADHDMILRLIRAGIKPVYYDIVASVMTIGGLSMTQQSRAFSEFRDVIIKHGMSPLVANFFYHVKIIRSKYLSWN